MLRYFAAPFFLSFAVLAAVLVFGGVEAFVTVGILSVLEVTLSFDNAVVNAQVLRRMTPRWQKRFLTWGILIAVIGTRLILPIFLVAAAAWMSPLVVAHLALFDGARYSALLDHAHFAINAFGGVFLMLLSLRFFFNSEKRVHWIHAIERQLARLGDVEALEIAIVLWLLLGLAAFVPLPERSAVLIGGVVAVIVSVGVEAFVGSFSKKGDTPSAGLALFIYLNVLDSAFSLDGVVGAFALTFSLPLIVLGLGIGAFFVRTLTLYLVEHRVLESLRFIEHGAYWAIFGLALSMLVNIFLAVPEIITGSVGALFMLAAYVSSVRPRRA